MNSSALITLVGDTRPYRGLSERFTPLFHLGGGDILAAFFLAARWAGGSPDQHRLSGGHRLCRLSPCAWAWVWRTSADERSLPHRPSAAHHAVVQRNRRGELHRVCCRCRDTFRVGRETTLWGRSFGLGCFGNFPKQPLGRLHCLRRLACLGCWGWVVAHRHRLRDEWLRPSSGRSRPRHCRSHRAGSRRPAKRSRPTAARSSSIHTSLPISLRMRRLSRKVA